MLTLDLWALCGFVAVPARWNGHTRIGERRW
jgi:hypothetical protein